MPKALAYFARGPAPHENINSELRRLNRLIQSYVEQKDYVSALIQQRELVRLYFDTEDWGKTIEQSESGLRLLLKCARGFQHTFEFQMECVFRVFFRVFNSRH